MNIKKTKISWFFFAIYAITYLYLGVCIGNTMSHLLNLDAASLSCIVVVMVILLAFAGCAAALIVFVRTRPKDARAQARRKRRAARQGSFFAKEILPALASYLLVLISRGIYIVHFSGGKLSGNVGLYERISSGVRVDYDIFHGVERLYSYLMKAFCILLGNVPDAVYILNLICQVIMVFFCYLFLRIAVGRAAAISSSVLFLCIPYFYRALTDCEPAQLLMALCMAVICMLVFVLKRSVFDLGGKGMFPAYLLCGLFSGMLFALDLTALIIPLTVIVVFCVSVQGRRAELVCFVIGVIVGVPVGMLLLNVDVSGTLFSVKTSSFPLIERAKFDFSKYMTSYELALSHPSLIFMLPQDLALLGVIAFGGIASVLFFWCGHDVLRIIAVPYLCMIPFACFDTGYVLGFDTGFLIACVGVMSAAMTVGMTDLMGKPVMEAETDGTHGNKADTDKEESDDAQTDLKMIDVVTEEKRNIKEKGTVKKKETVKEKESVKEKENVKEKADLGRTEIIKEKTKPRFIENPLPLPKKREHHEMDYTYEISEERMHYDVEVRDKDDFDQ